jgi:hypothetical protein
VADWANEGGATQDADAVQVEAARISPRASRVSK